MSRDYYKPEDIPMLWEKLSELSDKSASLKLKILTHTFRTDQGKEHAIHGFSRRAGLLSRCVKRVFELLPPNLDERPCSDEITDATIYLHAFYVNIFGACDNIAWLVVAEKEIKKPNGDSLPVSNIGIRKINKNVRGKLSGEFISLLDKFENWFEHVEDFRHSLAHRIPLYVPPYVVVKSKAEDYRRLEEASWSALKSGELDKSKALEAEKMKLTNFRPWFTHSFLERSPQMVIHPQLLSDFGALVEIADAAMKEIS